MQTKELATRRVDGFVDMGTTHRPLRDRRHAGELLAFMLQAAEPRGTLLVAVSAGGLEVAAAIARQLRMPVCPALVTNVVLPGGGPADRIGVIAFDGTVTLDHTLLDRLRVEEQVLSRALGVAVKKHARDTAATGRSRIAALHGANVILIDDAIATGRRMRAAIRAAKRAGASATIVAAPAASAHAAMDLTDQVDAFHCVALVRGGDVRQAYESLPTVTVRAATAAVRAAGRAGARTGRA